MPELECALGSVLDSLGPKIEPFFVHEPCVDNAWTMRGSIIFCVEPSLFRVEPSLFRVDGPPPEIAPKAFVHSSGSFQDSFCSVPQWCFR